MTISDVELSTDISYPDFDQVHEMYLLFICNIQCYLPLSCGAFIDRWAIYGHHDLFALFNYKLTLFNYKIHYGIQTKGLHYDILKYALVFINRTH
jgi:hypothetical protein